MKYWKYIDFPQQEQMLQQITAWFHTTGLLHAEFNWNEVSVDELMTAAPLLKAGLEHLKVHATYAVIIYKGDDGVNGEQGAAPLVHVDHMPGVMARLLFPVLNTAGSYTVFYKTNSPGVFEPYDNGKASMQYRLEDCEEVDRVELTRPIILRIDKPHAVHCNMETLPRVSLSLRLNKDPVRWMLTL